MMEILRTKRISRSKRKLVDVRMAMRIHRALTMAIASAPMVGPPAIRQLSRDIIRRRVA
jgi:hypothetical protein